MSQHLALKRYAKKLIFDDGQFQNWYEKNDFHIPPLEFLFQR